MITSSHIPLRNHVPQATCHNYPTRSRARATRELYVTKAQAATMLRNAELRRLAREGRVGFVTINSLAHYHK